MIKNQETKISIIQLNKKETDEKKKKKNRIRTKKWLRQSNFCNNSRKTLQFE